VKVASDLRPAAALNGGQEQARISIVRSNRPDTRPVVSVVVSTRNHARLLGETVRAVMEQDLDVALEMIVVDNASSDDTPAVMRAAVDGARHRLTYARLPADRGPAGGRNFGIELARGEFIAFTDSDCTPSPTWLKSALAAFVAPDVGIVQGRTVASVPAPGLFSHYIETLGLDGSFSTSNVVYRRQALKDRRFDAGCTYWEDVDLGWRVLGDNWQARFARDALIRHEVIALSPWQWLMWPRRFANWPAKAGRYPGFRRHLFLGVWISPLHLWFDLAVVGALVAPWQPLALALILPYAVAFARKRNLRGRFPPAKLLAHVGWDAVALASLVAGSARHRALVL
jgi:glycosyltransferase involved in cell wall biosynthesis